MLAHVLSFSIKLFDNILSTEKHNIQVLHAYKYLCRSNTVLLVITATAEGPHDMPVRRIFAIIVAR